jgi:hypothetical protein
MPAVQPLQQSTLINSLNRMQPSSDNTKKRSITLISGGNSILLALASINSRLLPEEVDLQTISSDAPVRPEVRGICSTVIFLQNKYAKVVQAMKARIIEVSLPWVAIFRNQLICNTPA